MTATEESSWPGIDVSGDPYTDLEREAQLMLMRE
jgi:hypothetical protein